MPPKLNREYCEMLHTPVLSNSLEGPRKDTIESLQEQIDFYFGEIYRLKYIQNTQIAISRLPAEILSEIFLHIVEDDIKHATWFGAGTFNFLRVCKRWNEVAINFPRLWVWWASAAIRVWPLFNARSKNAPLFLACRSRPPTPTRHILMDPAVSRRIRQLNFSGIQEELVDLLGAFGSNPLPNASSIRLQITPAHGYDEPPERLTHFLSSPFPELSKLDIRNFIPAFTSPVFTTSNLTSLKLYFLGDDKRRHTLSQFSQILQHHPNLQELDLERGGIPRPEPSGPPVPFVLPRLVDLRLRGMKQDIMGFIDLIGMSSPLHNVDIYFQRDYSPNVLPLTSAMGKIVKMYYGCLGLGYSRTVNSLTISSIFLENDITLDARSHSASLSHPMSNLKLEFDGVRVIELMEAAFPLFPLDHVRELAVERSSLSVSSWRWMLRKMELLSHLRLHNLDVGPVLDALDFDDQAETPRPPVPKLQSLTLSYLDTPSGKDEKLSDILAWRREHNIGLESLVVQSCRVESDGFKMKFEGLVEKVTWEDVTVKGSDYQETENEEDSYSYYEDPAERLVAW